MASNEQINPNLGYNITAGSMEPRGSLAQVISDLVGNVSNAANQTQTNTQTLPYQGSSSYTGGYSPAGGYSPDDVRYLDDQIVATRGQLKNIDTIKAQGLTNILNSYNSRVNNANYDRGQTLEQFGLQREDSIRGREASLGKVDQNSYTLANSLRRLLGMASGSGSSAYQLAAPRAIGNLADAQRGNVLETYGQNERDLVRSEGDATTAFDRLLEELALDRKQREASHLADIYGQRQGVYENLGNLSGQRAELIGGGYDEIRAAQQPYTSKISEFQRLIEGLPANYNQPVNINPVKVDKPQLRDYTVDRASINTQNQSGGSTSSPYSYFLKKKFNGSQV